LNSHDVIETLGECMLEHGVPEYVRSDNGAEMTAKRVRAWLQALGSKPLFIEPGRLMPFSACPSVLTRAYPIARIYKTQKHAGGTVSRG
jgi:transposase InsO family protein